jgi:glutamate/tyrosine decarboxylase-like PLP-dependent enzyme
MIADDIALAGAMAAAIERQDELELVTQSLSITTFRYLPPDLRDSADRSTAEYLNRLNATLLDELQRGGEIFVSNAVIGGRYALRACIVNFHTTAADVEAVPAVVVAHGRRLDRELRASQTPR